MQETPVQFLGQVDSLGEGIGYPLQYSGLENSMDYTVRGVAKSWTWLSNFHFHFIGKKGGKFLSEKTLTKTWRNSLEWHINESPSSLKLLEI